MTSRRANGEGSIFPYRNGFAAYVWITTPSGKRQREYLYGRTQEIVHSRWIELTRKAARGPTVTKVPTVVQTSCTDVLLYLQLNGSGPDILNMHLTRHLLSG